MSDPFNNSSEEELWEELSSFTPAPGSAAGRSPSDSLAGPTIDPSGPPLSLASLSRLLPQIGKAWKTTDISGLSGSHSSPSIDLQRSLESRLLLRMAAHGSLEYALTWRRWDIGSGPPICALRASTRRISDRDFIGWPTPDAQAMNVGCDPVKHLARLEKLKVTHKNGSGAGLTLGAAAALTGWPTTTTRDSKYEDGKMRKGGASLPVTAQLMGWATPSKSDGEGSRTLPLGTTAAGKRPDGKKAQVGLVNQEIMAGYPTPNAWDSQGSHGGGQGASLRTTVQLMSHGDKRNSEEAPTEKRGALNPDLARWLMGFPVAWAYCGATAMQSCRKSPRNSSGRSSTSKKKSLDKLVSEL